MDLDNMAAYDSNNEEIHFTPTEFAMLTYLMKNAARAVPRSELLPTVWGFENDSGTRVADDTVKRLRKKLQNTICPSRHLGVRLQGPGKIKGFIPACRRRCAG